MNEPELIQLIYKHAPKGTMSRLQIKACIRALGKAMTEALVTTGSVQIPGVVKLFVTDLAPRAERHGKHPITGAPMYVPAQPATKRVRARVSRPTTAAVRA
jgi:nucleoid DNA-binding protein